MHPSIHPIPSSIIPSLPPSLYRNILSKRITDILALIRERGERVLEEEEEAVEDGEEATRGNSPCKTRQNQQRLLARKCRLVLVSRNNAIWKQHQQQPLDQVQEDDADDDHFEDIRSAGEPSSTNGLVLVNHHSRSWFSILHHPSSHRYSVLTRLLEIIKHLLDSNTLTTKRDVYYKDVNLFVSQTVVDKAIEDLAFSFGVPRFCLNVVKEEK